MTSECAAWASFHLGSCTPGTLRWADGVVAFDADGEPLFERAVAELRPRFPWYLRNEGLVVEVDGHPCTILFGDPALSGAGDAGRAEYRRWRELLASAEVREQDERRHPD